jgi:beta-lactamase regulating signal transducer with metallopeptidase domain
MLSAMGEAPSVGGVLRPHISLPQGIDRLLSKAELEAVLIHEVIHARRRDNLIGLLHELALCGLWFHPLVWLTGFRLAMFRELSCDDSVIASSRGVDLVSALAKLAVPEDSHLLRAGAASLLSHRVARLTTSEPRRTNHAADWLLIAVFAGIFLGGVFGTIAHNPSCGRIYAAVRCQSHPRVGAGTGLPNFPAASTRYRDSVVRGTQPASGCP